MINLPETEIVNLYVNGMSLINISKKYNCSRAPIERILKRNKILLRKKTDHAIKYHDLDLNFFKEITCEEQAYFLGLLYSDGNVYKKNCRGTVKIELQHDDKIILEKFRDIICPSYIIRNNTDRSSCIFSMNREEICDQLINLGCPPKKSLIISFPNYLSKNLITHFIRGYFDGDGNISIFQRVIKNFKYTDFSCSFVSTKKFCEAAAIIIENELSIHCGIYILENKITTKLSIQGRKQVLKFLNWIYNSSNIYLPRKYDQYLKIKNF